MIGEIESDKAHPAGWFGMLNAHYPNRVNNPLPIHRQYEREETLKEQVGNISDCWENVHHTRNGDMVIHAVLKHHKSKLQKFAREAYIPFVSEEFLSGSTCIPASIR